jgi:hypothetical protein
MRLLSFLILLLAAVGPNSPKAQTPETLAAPGVGSTRTSIALFRYRGAVSGTESGAQFDAFRGLIEQKIENLRESVGSALITGGPVDVSDYISHLFVRYVDQDDFQGNSQIYDWIWNERSVLEVFRGTILHTPRGEFILNTRCHLIEDSAQANASSLKVFSIELALTPEEFANARDSHSLIMLYSIASEVRRLGMPRDKVAVIVGEALNTLADLERRQGALPEGMLAIKQAWLEFKDAL